MPYKTLALKLLRSFPALHSQLRRDRQLPAALQACSLTLRTRHQELMDQFLATNPASNPEQLTSAALEVALGEMTGRLAAASRPDSDLLTLEAAITYVRSSPTA